MSTATPTECFTPYDSMDRSVPCRYEHCRAPVGVACNGVGAHGVYSHPVRSEDGLRARRADA